MNDAEELARLRSRVTELETQLTEAQLAAAQRPETGAPAARERRSRGAAWRSFTAGLLIVLACLLAPVSVASVWASREISNTDQYVKTVAPVIHDPGVQKAIANEVTTAIMQNLDVQGLTSDALQTVAQQPNMPPRVASALPALAIPLTRGIESFTRTQATNLVSSAGFAKVWDQVNRTAHTQVVTLLEGNQGGAISAQGDSITLNLGPVIAQVKDRLVAQGFSLASRIPTVDKSFVLVQSGAVTNAQRFYSVLTTLGAWLPFVALALLAAGVYLARDRRAALLRGSLGVAGAMLLLGLALTLARILYVETTPAGILTSESAGNVFETLVRFLRTGVRTTGVLALVVALGAFLSGPSGASVRTRATMRRGIGSLRGGAESAGFHTGRFGAGLLVAAHRLDRGRGGSRRPGRPGPDRVPRPSPGAGNGGGRGPRAAAGGPDRCAVRAGHARGARADQAPGAVGHGHRSPALRGGRHRIILHG
jgi:hypothetical protein